MTPPAHRTGSPPRRSAPLATRLLGDEAGLFAGIEALAFGVLLFVGGTLIVLNAWAVVDAKTAATAAAREATRVFVESTGPASHATERARAAATATLTGHGRRTDPAPAVEVTMTPDDPAGGLVRCARVTTRVELEVGMVVIPWLGAFADGPIRVVGEHIELVDPYRSGLPGEATCAH